MAQIIMGLKGKMGQKRKTLKRIQKLTHLVYFFSGSQERVVY